MAITDPESGKTLGEEQGYYAIMNNQGNGKQVSFGPFATPQEAQQSLIAYVGQNNLNITGTTGRNANMRVINPDGTQVSALPDDNQISAWEFSAAPAWIGSAL